MPRLPALLTGGALAVLSARRAVLLGAALLLAEMTLQYGRSATDCATGPRDVPCHSAQEINKMLAGEIFVVSFDIDGLQVKEDGSVQYSMGMEVVDSKGAHVGTALLDAAKKGGGWVDYVWPRPGTTKPVRKSAYSMQAKGPDSKTYYVGAGGYELK